MVEISRLAELGWRKLLFWSVLSFGFLFFLTIILFPFYWMVVSSLKTLSELFAKPPVFLPSHPVEMLLERYSEALFFYKFLYYSINSIYVSVMTTLLTTSLATIGGYAVARLRFKGKNFMSSSILLIYTLPGILLVVPLYAMMARIGLVDTLNGLILTYLAQTLPVAIYMLGGYFKTIPAEIEESALMDGCSRFEVIWRITVPLSLPAIITVALYTFMIAWNEFLFAFMFLTSLEKFTLPIALSHMFKSIHIPWGATMAGSVVLTIPVIVLFLFFEKYLVKGLTAGAVKG